MRISEREGTTASRDAFGLAGQVAVVTGAGTGLGRASAVALADAGVADVGREAEVEAMKAETVRRFGAFHFLVDDAGVQLDVSTALGRVVCMGSVHQTIPGIRGAG